MAGKTPAFPPPLFEGAPIVFSSTHGIYWPEVTPDPFVVPAKTYIFETQYVGDLCLTSIDPLIWKLIQGDNRPQFNKLLSGKFKMSSLTREEKQLLDVFRYVNYYEPGDRIYNRYLSIGGGTTAGKTSARIHYANMGFYLFPVGAPADRYPDGPRSKILNKLRDRMIMGALEEGKTGDDVQLTYEEFIKTVYKAKPDLRKSGCIFIFSCCAEARRQDISKSAFSLKINEIELAQQAQHEKFMALTSVAMGGPLNSKKKSGAAAAPSAAAVAGGEDPAAAAMGAAAAVAGAPAAKSTVVIAPRREGLRRARPREFHPSAFEPDKLEYRQLADAGWADREVMPHPDAPVQPEGTYAIFQRIVEEGGRVTFKQVMDLDAGPFLSERDIRAYMRSNPAADLKVYMPDGSFADIATVLKGGKRTRRRRAQSRKTRRRR